MPFVNIKDGVEVSTSDFTVRLDHDLSVAFSAIFDAGACHQHVIGADLADRPYNSDREDIIYVDHGHPIVGVTYLRGIALYVRDARDTTAIVRVAAIDSDNEDNEVDICEPLAFSSPPHSGIVRRDYEEPCLIPEGITGYLRIDTLSRATDAPRNLLSYSEASADAEFLCRLVVNSRPQPLCNRVYSLQAITSEKHCYSNVIPEVEEMQNAASIITAQQNEPEILFDFRHPVWSMELNDTCSEALHGPIKYLDKAHPLKAGIVKEIKYHYSSLPSTDTFFAVVWRYDDRARLAVNSDEVDNEEYYEHNEEYYVHCVTLASPPQMGETQGSAWMPNGCVAKDGDYLGFIYSGTAPIPISYTHLGEVDSDSHLHLSVIDDKDHKNLVILPISDDQQEASYTFGNSVGNLQFNITALQCTVKYETTMNEQTQWNDIPYDLYVGNALYTRNETENDALIVLDLLNAVAVDGYVTSFHIDPNYHSSSITTLMMVRPIIEQDDQETDDLMDPTSRISKVEVVCSLNIVPSHTEEYELDEPCRVEPGDRLAVSSLGSESSLSFDLIDGYPCEFLDQTLSVIDNHECHRMYSMGYNFSKIQRSELLGNDLIDRPHNLFAPLNTENVDNDDEMDESMFVFDDLSTSLRQGTVHSYRVFIENDFDWLELSVMTPQVSTMDSSAADDYEWLHTCKLLVEGHRAVFGPNTFAPEEAFTDEECIISAGSYLRVTVSNGPQALGFTCDQHSRSTLAFNDSLQLSPQAIKCLDRMVVSVGVEVSDSRARFVEHAMEQSPVDYQNYIFSEFSSTTGTHLEHQRINCEGPEEIFSNELLNFSAMSEVPMMYLDQQSEPLSAGYLEKWDIKVVNAWSKLLAVVWRSRPESYGYEIVCAGLADSTQLQQNETETIYPDSICRVEDGDRLGFIATSNPSMDSRIRIGYTSDMNGSCLGATYANFERTKIVKHGIYTLTPEGCEQSHVYSFRAQVCLSLEQSECRFGRSLPSDEEENDQAALVSMPEEDMSEEEQVIYVDTRAPLPLGGFLSWNLLVSEPMTPIYPVVWRQTGESSFEVACLAHDDNMDMMAGVHQVYPINRCEILDMNYYVGFITPYQRHMTGQRIDFRYAEVATKSIVRSFSMPIKVFHGYRVDFGEPINIGQMETERIYNISGNVCTDNLTCISHMDVTQSSIAALDRFILLEEFATNSCMTRLTINSARENTDFALINFRPSEPATRASQNMEVVDYRLLRTSDALGQNVFELNGFCGMQGDLIGYSFFNRRMPFKTDEEASTINYLAYSTERVENMREGESLLFYRNSDVGHAPAEYCFRTYQTIGTYMPLDFEDEDSQQLVVRYNDDETRAGLTVLDKMPVSLDGRLLELSIDVRRAGCIKLLALSVADENNDSNGENRYRIEAIWNFNLERVETAYLHSWSGEEFNVEKGILFALAETEARVSYKVLSESDDDSSDLRPQFAEIDIADLSVGGFVETNKTSFVPKFGVRVGFEQEIN